MGWLSGIIGGGIGAVIAGPFGAVIGAAIGSSMGAQRQVENGGFAQQGKTTFEAQRRQAIFFTAAFSMVGKLAKADGRVCEDEIAAIRRIAAEAMGLDEQTRRFAIEILNRSKTSAESFEDYAREFAGYFAQDQQMCSFMLTFLFEVAMADGKLHPSEEAMLRLAKAHFRLSDTFYNSLHAQFVGAASSAPSSPSFARHYETLGVSANASDMEIKKAWRRKCAEFHPDKIEGKGLPPEFIKFANDKLAEVNGAYDAVIKSRRG